MSIAENVKEIRKRIETACEKAGRSPDEVTLVAATKMNSGENVREAVLAGIDASGENRVQEMLEKLSQGAYTGAPLHFIGHLQKNKVRQVVGVCDLIQSVSSKELIELIGKRALSLGITQDILIEVNIGREDAKSGVLPEELEGALALSSDTPGVRVRGLMAIPPISTIPGGNRNYFDQMYQLFIDMKAKKYDNVDMYILSMGMSGDFEDAIASGATMVRVGSAIFGARKY